MTLKTIEGTFIAPQGKFALVVGRFNSFVVESLVSGAVDALVRHGIAEDAITIIRAPGAFEIPLVAQKVAQLGEYDAIIALGAAAGKPVDDFGDLRVGAQVADQDDFIDASRHGCSLPLSVTAYNGTSLND